jgi:choline dehydrogenase-like flavoprotein
MPTMLSSNLNAGALMIGEKGAAHILDKKLPATEGVSAH